MRPPPPTVEASQQRPARSEHEVVEIFLKKHERREKCLHQASVQKLLCVCVCVCVCVCARALFRAALHLWHMEVPRLGVKSEVQLLAYTAASAKPDPSCVCKLHHSSRQRWIPDPLSEARDQTHILNDTSWFHFCCTIMGRSSTCTFK